MSVSALPGRRCVSIRSLTKIWLVLLLMLSANGCTIAREALYAPRESPIDIREWTNTPPEEIKVVTSDGLTLTGYYWPGDPDDKDIVVFFHGRGAHQGVGAKYAQYIAGHGDNVLVASYRGFGGNPGQPSKPGLLKDADAFIGEARKRAGAGARLWLVGHSLGSAVALQAAIRDAHPAGVFAIGAFANISDATPLGLGALLPDQWNNVEQIEQLKAPIILFHGGKDDVVPASSSEELLEAASGPAAFISMKDWTHKPVMQKLGPWISHAIETMRGGKVDMLPELLKGWSLAGSHPQCQDCMH